MNKDDLQRELDKIKRIYELAREDNKNLRQEVQSMAARAKIKDVQMGLLIEFMNNVNRRYAGYTGLVQMLGAFLNSQAAQEEIPDEIKDTIDYMRNNGLLDI